MAELIESEKLDATTPALADSVYGDTVNVNTLSLPTLDKPKTVIVNKEQDTDPSLLSELGTSAAVLAGSKLLLLSMSRRSWASRALLGGLWRRLGIRGSEDTGTEEPLGRTGARNPFPDRDLETPVHSPTAGSIVKKYCVELPLDLFLHCPIDSKVTLGSIWKKYFGRTPAVTSDPFSRDGVWPEFVHPSATTPPHAEPALSSASPPTEVVVPTATVETPPAPAAEVAVPLPPATEATAPIPPHREPPPPAPEPLAREAEAPAAARAPRTRRRATATPPGEGEASASTRTPRGRRRTTTQPPATEAEAKAPPIPEVEVSVQVTTTVVPPPEPAVPPEPAAPPSKAQLDALQQHFQSGGQLDNLANEVLKPPSPFNFNRFAQGMKPAEGQENVEFVHLATGGWSRRYTTVEGLTVDETMLPNGARVFQRSDNIEEVYQRIRRRWTRIN